MTGTPNAAQLEKKTRLGAFFLTLRTILLQATSASVFVLYRLLDPADFGAFAVVSFALAFFQMFGDAGLGAALIQKDGEPTEDELSSVWWLQLGLSLLIVALVFAVAPLLVRLWPSLSPSYVWLFRILALNLVFTVLRVIPAILLERELEFGRLSALDVLLSTAYYGAAIGLAFAGFGVYSFILAVLVRGLLGVFGIYWLRPWRPSWRFRWSAVKPLLSYGVTFQGKHIVGFIVGGVLPAYGGWALTQRGVGFLNWAQTTAFFPLQFVGIVGRLTFPLYSRMQGDRALFTKTLERAIGSTTVLTLLTVSFFIGLGEPMVRLVFGEKWVPAVPLLYAYSVGIAIGFLTPVAAAALDATGRAGVTLRLSVLALVLVWTLVPLGTYFAQELGFALGYVASMWIGNIVMIFVVAKELPQSRLWPQTRVAVIAFFAAVLAGRAVIHSWSAPILSPIVGAVAVLGAFVAVLVALDRKGLRSAYALIRGKRDEFEATVVEPEPRRAGDA